MKQIKTPRLLIRDWREEDREAFYRMNSDEPVMAFFPFRRTRAEADAFFSRLRAETAAETIGFAALELRETGECIGFAGLHADDVVPSLPAGAVEIGWRLLPEYWGRGYATEAAKALLAEGFLHLGLTEIVSYAVWNNERSTAVMRRLGMVAEPAHDFDHSSVPDTHPRLKRHVFYRITREKWLARMDER